MKKLLSSIGAVVALGWASSPLAHHSFAMFDQTRKVAIEGTIAEIQWTNPHVWIHVDVQKEDGTVEQWPIEFTSRVHLTRRGFPINDIHVGDAGKFTVSPYANGQPGGRFYILELDKGIVHLDPGARQYYEQTQRAAAE